MQNINNFNRNNLFYVIVLYICIMISEMRAMC